MYTLAEADPVAESPAALILSYGMLLQIVPMTLKRNFRKCLKNFLIVKGTEQLLVFKFCSTSGEMKVDLQVMKLNLPRKVKSRADGVKLSHCNLYRIDIAGHEQKVRRGSEDTSDRNSGIRGL